MRRLMLLFVLFLALLPQSIFAKTDGTDEFMQEQFVPAELDADSQVISNGLNAFGIDLYRAMREQSGNLIISPASISTAFGLAYAGAKGATANEIAATLHYPTTLRDFHASFGKLLSTMKLKQRGRTLAVNNAIWLQNGLPVHNAYVSLVNQHYQAGLRRVDYVADSETARSQINKWVEHHTNNKIQNLLTAVDVTRDTKSVLVNTVYFKADWALPFDKKVTKIEPFMLESGKKQKQPLMHQRENFAYAEQDGVKALSLPYRGGETEMVLLLPNNPKDLPKLENSLTSDSLKHWFDSLRTTYSSVIVTLPRFKVERRYELKATLFDLGMHTPFSNQSDFSAMKPVELASNNPNEWNLKINEVIHKVLVEVEEKGTEAAAATALTSIIVTGSRRVTPAPPPKIFNADHPFIFIIRDRRTQIVLFLGRYTGDATP
jgi:serpin B